MPLSPWGCSHFAQSGHLVQWFSFGAAFVTSTWLNPHVTGGGGRMPAEAEGLPWVLSQAGLLSKIFSQSLKANPEGTSGQAPQYFSTTVEKEEVSSPCSTKSKARLEPRWWDEAGSRLRAAWGLGHCTHQLLLGGDSSRDGGKGHCTADTLRFTLQTSK